MTLWDWEGDCIRYGVLGDGHFILSHLTGQADRLATGWLPVDIQRARSLCRLHPLID
jgi:hypothetical protein